MSSDRKQRGGTFTKTPSSRGSIGGSPYDIKTTLAVVVGCGNVGKTALTGALKGDAFKESYHQTIDDSYRLQFEFGPRGFPVDVLDTAGQEEYTSLATQHIAQADLLICVYNTCKPDTLRRLISIFADAYRTHSEAGRVRPDFHKYVLIVGNKVDLPEREVVDLKHKELQAVLEAFRFNFNPPEDERPTHLFTSAKTGYGIEALYKQIATLMYALRLERGYELQEPTKQQSDSLRAQGILASDSVKPRKKCVLV